MDYLHKRKIVHRDLKVSGEAVGALGGWWALWGGGNSGRGKGRRASPSTIPPLASCGLQGERSGGLVLPPVPHPPRLGSALIPLSPPNPFHSPSPAGRQPAAGRDGGGEDCRLWGGARDGPHGYHDRRDGHLPVRWQGVGVGDGWAQGRCIVATLCRVVWWTRKFVPVPFLNLRTRPTPSFPPQVDGARGHRAQPVPGEGRRVQVCGGAVCLLLQGLLRGGGCWRRERGERLLLCGCVCVHLLPGR